jgi:hypothetical protein
MKNLNIAIFLLCISPNVFSQSYLFDSIPDNLKRRADAVIRSKQCLYTINKPGSAVEKIREVITLLNEDATGYRYLQVNYDKFSRINYIRGKIYDAKGNIIEALGISDIYDMSAMSGDFYSDDRTKLMYFPIHKYPYTIEFEYEKTYSSLLNYPTWEFQDSPDVSVEKSGIQFVVPENMKFRYYEAYSNNNVDSSILDGKKIYTWQEENIPAYHLPDVSIIPVYYSPTLYTAPLDFEYGGYKGSLRSWKDFGSWVYEINKNRDALPQEEISAISDIVSKTDDPREKVNLVYEYMQSKTRYVSIQIGIGGFQTAEASAVSKNGYGDCKALVNYTYSLLKAVGINSFYSLINATSKSDINTSFVANKFNHVILCVPITKDTIWLECTNQTNPFNYLGLGDAGKHVLLITPEGGKMVRTPEFSKDQTLFKRTGSLYLNYIGTLSGKISDSYSGFNLGYAKGNYSLQSDDEIKENLYSELRFTDFKVSSVDYSENKSETPSADLIYQLAVNNFASANGSRMYFNPVISVQDYLQEMPVQMRIQFPYITVDSIAYNLPQNYKVEYLPENVNIENEFGKYSYILEVKGEKIIYRRIIEINKSNISIAKYQEFRTFINLIAKTDRERIILVKTVG